MTVRNNVQHVGQKMYTQRTNINLYVNDKNINRKMGKGYNEAIPERGNASKPLKS